ncbi:MAG: hypothetical protein KGL53_01760, partial [Elusimicrobia bacterium]|nr:hypothetical protein [Elusimicrobiota bacterium]
SGTGALAQALVLAAALGALRPRRLWGRAGLGLAAASLLLLFMFGDWWQARQWAQAWSVGQDVLGKVEARARALPPAATLLLVGAPIHVNGGVVFVGWWDWPQALRLRTGRFDLQGDVIHQHVSWGKDGLAWLREGARVVVPYKDLHIYDYAHDKIYAFEGPPAAGAKPR